ncbi:MAG: DUF4126 domain-containing protein [Anaerolineaceae bacterium]|jgi:hypothetical protein|nr:DUF4126 domain-containing protein [Anaerolineaceae bacterium]
MDILGIFSAFGLSASAGLNAYIPLLVVALLGRFTNLIKLQQPWDGLTSWWIIGLLIVLSLIEFFADSTPAVNHINDIIQTFIRPTAGAIVFAASANVLTEISPILSLACGLLVAGSIHAVKSTIIRPTVTATTAGVGNLPISMLEDATSTIISVLSIMVPIVVLVLLIILIAWMISRRRRRKSYQD